MVTHEGQGVAAAAGYALASKGLGFFAGSGVGLPNSLSNLYCAWKDRVPLIASYTGGELGREGEDAAEDWDHHLKPAEPFTNWTGDLLTNSVTAILRRAIKFAFGPPSGPVALDWGNAAEGQRIKAPIYKMDLANARSSFRAKADLIQKAAQWLAEAENPVFLVGPEVSREGAGKELQQLAEKLAVPVAVLGWPNEIHANFPTDHPLFVGRVEVLRSPTDLLINFGERFAIRQPEGTHTVHISHDPESLGRTFPVDLAIASEIRSSIKDLSDALDGMLTKDRMNKIRTKRYAEVSALTAKLKQSRDVALRGRFDTAPLSWERVGYELEKALDKDAVIVPETGTQSQKLLGQLIFAEDKKLRIGRTTGSALGWGVAAAFGVNVALPNRQVVAIQGDGGFLFGQSETLWSISRYEAPMLIVIMNNRIYNETRVRNNLGGGTLFQAGKELTGYLGNPNVEFTKIAEAYGLKGEKVKTPGDLAPALQRAVRSMRDGKAVLMDIDIAPDGPALADDTWYQHYSIAQIRNGKRAG